MFDIDDENCPIIKAQVEHSEDVRDKIAERFTFNFSKGRNLCFAHVKLNVDKPSEVIIESVVQDEEGFKRLLDILGVATVSYLQTVIERWQKNKSIIAEANLKQLVDESKK